MPLADCVPVNIDRVTDPASVLFRPGSVALSVICEVSWTKPRPLPGRRGLSPAADGVDHVTSMDRLL